MKNIVLSAFVIAASAQSISNNTPTKIPTASVTKLTSDGQVGELKVVNGDELYIWFYISWINVITYLNFGDGYEVQNYAQWIDDEETGMYGGFTCNTNYR